MVKHHKQQIKTCEKQATKTLLQNVALVFDLKLVKDSQNFKEVFAYVLSIM